MQKSWPSLLLLLLLVVTTGCGRGATTPTTPTPFPAAAITVRPLPGEPITLSLENLSADPALFEGALLQLTGSYERLPRLLCDHNPHPSPATWGLVGDGVIAYAGGLDAQLRPILTDGQTITAQGRWLRWRGPVGCGKTAQVEEIWYLSVSQIIEPNPLTRATATPIVVAAAPTPTAVIPTATAGEPLTTPTASPGSDTAISPTAGTPLTATAVTPGVTTPITTTTATPLATVANTPATVAPGTATATAAPGTPTITATPSGSDSVNKGSIDIEELQIDSLLDNETHAWTLTLSVSSTITVTSAPADSNANLALALLEADGTTVIAEQNSAPAGAVETLMQTEALDVGTYQIQVSAANGTSSDYALLVLDNLSTTIRLQGNIQPGGTVNDTLEQDEVHIWFFTAAAGDTVNATLTPDSNGDAVLVLYGPRGEPLEEIDAGPDPFVGEPERLTDYVISQDGMYGLGVEEFDLAPMSYELKLELQ